MVWVCGWNAPLTICMFSLLFLSLPPYLWHTHSPHNGIVVVQYVDNVPQLVRTARCKRAFIHVSMWIQYQFISALASGFMLQYATRSCIVRMYTYVWCYSIIQFGIRCSCSWNVCRSNNFCKVHRVFFISAKKSCCLAEKGGSEIRNGYTSGFFIHGSIEQWVWPSVSYLRRLYDNTG